MQADVAKAKAGSNGHTILGSGVLLGFYILWVGHPVDDCTNIIPTGVHVITYGPIVIRYVIFEPLPYRSGNMLKRAAIRAQMTKAF
jgi:hypothetical protein